MTNTAFNVVRVSRLVKRMDKKFTAPEAAKMLGLSHYTVRQYCWNGRIKAEKFGTVFAISQESIDAFKKMTGRV